MFHAGIEPGSAAGAVQNHVAMSRCTNWPSKLSTNMVIDHFIVNIQTCMIHFCVRSKILIKMMYHTCLYAKSNIFYDHICTLFWRSVSASGHGNISLKKLPRPTRVRIRPGVACGRAFWGKFRSKFYLQFDSKFEYLHISHILWWQVLVKIDCLELYYQI